MNSSELFSLRRPNTHQVKTLISLIPFRPSARSITWYEESAHIPLLSLIFFLPFFSLFSFPILLIPVLRGCLPPNLGFWQETKWQQKKTTISEKNPTISDCTPGMARVVNLSCGSYSQAKCDDFNATTCLPDVRWTKNVNFQEKRPIKQKWFITSGWIWNISKLHG